MPNLTAGLMLARQGRGAAVVSEAYNSNSLNLIVGAYLPTLFIAPHQPSTLACLSMWWLVAATILSAALFLRRRRLGRLGAAVLVASWLGFALVVLTQ